jgi:hypothetical protein
MTVLQVRRARAAGSGGVILPWAITIPLNCLRPITFPISSGGSDAR